MNFKEISFILIPILLVALPWHIFMIYKHGNGNILFFLQQSQMFERTVEGIEGNVKKLGLFFYPNQILIFFPNLIILGIYGIYKEILNPFSVSKLFLIWIFLYFLIISIVVTKLSVYLIPILIPLCFFAGKSLNEILEDTGSKTKELLLLSLTNIVFFWSLDISFRNEFKNLLSNNFINSILNLLSNHILLLLGFLIIQILIIIIYFKFEHLKKYFIYSFIFLPSFYFSFSNVFYYDKINYNDGMKYISENTKISSFSKIFSIGNGSNPQMTYYLDGLDIGWNNYKNFIRLEPKNGLDAIKKTLSDLNDKNILVIIEKEEIALGHYENFYQVVPNSFKEIFDSKYYALFTK